MTYLLDTDVLAGLMRKRPPLGLVERVRATKASDLSTSVVTVTELRAGAALREDRDLFWSRIEGQLLSRVRILPYDVRAGVIAGDVRALLRRRGTPIGLADVLIAAVALANDCTVVTHNVRHFERVPGLSVEDWVGS